MFGNGFDRVYHFQLKKCGGAVLNSWLDWHCAGSRLAANEQTDRLFALLADRQGAMRIGRVAFFSSPVIHSHLPLIDFAPAGTFSFTVLREPASRLIAQVSDWRREATAGAGQDEPAIIREAIADSARMPLRSFLEKHAATMPLLLDNHQTRMLAFSWDDGFARKAHISAIAERAQAVLATKFDLVGTAEDLQGVKSAVCAMLGVPPETAGRPQRLAEEPLTISAGEIEDARDIIDDLTRWDRDLYDLARGLFTGRRAATSGLSEATFERDHAATAVGRLSPEMVERAVFIPAGDAVVGSGFAEREETAPGQYRLWAESGARSVIYMPCPDNEYLTFHLWIRDFAPDGARNRVRFEIDDRPAPHVFAVQSGWEDRADIGPVRTARGFVKVAIIVDDRPAIPAETAAGKGPFVLSLFRTRRPKPAQPAPAEPPAQTSRRALSLGGYGWSVATEDIMDVVMPARTGTGGL